MQVKVIMTWNVKAEQDHSYFEFLLRNFVPKINRLGFELGDAWATVYGSRPQVMITALLPDEISAQRKLQSQEWQELVDQLDDFVTDFALKVVVARTGFQF